jgi:hypothetical protein
MAKEYFFKGASLVGVVIRFILDKCVATHRGGFRLCEALRKRGLARPLLYKFV